MTLKLGLGTNTADERLGAAVGAVGSGVCSVSGDTAGGRAGRAGGADAGGTVCGVGKVTGLVAGVFEKKKERMDDRANVCFICGISRAELDRHGDGFDAHIRAEHHTWVV